MFSKMKAIRQGRDTSQKRDPGSHFSHEDRRVTPFTVTRVGSTVYKTFYDFRGAPYLPYAFTARSNSDSFENVMERPRHHIANRIPNWGGHLANEYREQAGLLNKRSLLPVFAQRRTERRSKSDRS